MTNIYEENLRIIKEFENTISENKIYTEREVYSSIKNKINNFQKSRGLNIISLIGLRGTGKTTILRTIKKDFGALYATGEILEYYKIDLKELIKISEDLSREIIIIDEVTNLTDWEAQLKIFGDLYQNKLFIISSSSALILNTFALTLKRRMDLYKIHPLDFTEYLLITTKQGLSVRAEMFDIMFRSKTNLERYKKLINIESKIDKKLLKEYTNFKERQFPFLLNDSNVYEKTKDVIDKVIYKDIPKYNNLYTSNLAKIEDILRFLAVNEKTNFENIGRAVGLKRDIIDKIFDLALKSQLIFAIPDINATKSLRTNNKKILFNVPALRITLDRIHKDKTIGFGREDMFGFTMRKLEIPYAYNYKQDGYDFIADNIKFEIAGKDKTTKLAKDTIIIAEKENLKMKNDVLYIPAELFALL